MTKLLSTLAASALFAAVTSAASAQSLLDQQLGGQAPTPATKPADPAPKPAAAPAAKPDPTPPEVKPVPANGGDISSPGAVRDVDNKDLTKDLLHPDDKPNPDKFKEQMKEALDRMDQVQNLLQDKKDPGPVTQETQRRIMMDLDVLIEFARKQQPQDGQGQGDPNDPKDPSQGQGKQYSKGNGGSPGQGQGGNVAAAKDTLPGGGQATPDALQDIHSRGETWAGLRPAERNLINNGAHEDVVSTYTEQVRRYFQALGELGKTRAH